MHLTSGQKDVMQVLDLNLAQTTQQIVDRLESRTNHRNIWTYDRVHSILKRLENRDIAEKLRKENSEKYWFPTRWRRTPDAHEAYIRTFG